MKRNKLVLICFLLLIGLMGCSSQTTKSNEEREGIVLNGKTIKEISINSVKGDKIKSTTKASIFKDFATGVEKSETKSMLVDKEMFSAIEKIITVKYKDNTKQEYAVWINEGNGRITLGENLQPEKNMGTGYRFSVEQSKKLAPFIQ